MHIGARIPDNTMTTTADHVCFITVLILLWRYEFYYDILLFAFLFIFVFDFDLFYLTLCCTRISRLKSFQFTSYTNYIIITKHIMQEYITTKLYYEYTI
jgi:hypothetical protein